jgi:hypothetical protein
VEVPIIAEHCKAMLQRARCDPHIAEPGKFKA